MKLNTFFLAALATTAFSFSALAETTTVKEDAKELANDTGRATKKAVRTVKDKTCEMVNGKMECAAKKVKHTIQNGADKVEDAVE